MESVDDVLLDCEEKMEKTLHLRFATLRRNVKNLLQIGAERRHGDRRFDAVPDGGGDVVEAVIAALLHAKHHQRIARGCRYRLA